MKLQTNNNKIWIVPTYRLVIQRTQSSHSLLVEPSLTVVTNNSNNEDSKKLTATFDIIITQRAEIQGK
jgi:hypothetical protein